MKNFIKNILAATALVLLFSNCEAVIDVDLNSADPQTVIEGIVTDQPGHYQVSITKTINFDQPNDYPSVAGAFVTIADDAGLLDTLAEVSPGIYQTNRLAQGIPGRTYTLHVEAGGKEYNAMSTMPLPVPFDTLVTEQTVFAGELTTNLVPAFKDPLGLGNYYNFVVTKNGVRNTEIFALDDALSDGQTVTRPLFSQDLELKTGETGSVEMYCIDYLEYKYLLSLQLISGGDPGGGSTPANPDNNFGNACLGHFSAQPVQQRTIVVQ